ncbi:energy-coupling factor transporter transmembrane protein EcfT [Clostridium sp. CX1]|uniref:Energy-coupling factor transporter transmembrane component T n=1 Tax=Clostridium tanneri TaxID=3037988 RepID=A0ABU4JUN4_9CLOT|nr:MULTISPECIES: energy-coupling factor transporter transmembrane component T [unclassified Clostridium]MCT8976645.1 energy-coupling factor transporter transmembrane protein EcfT [Clostridium sp. CX1]MDW8801858.1 energy-coupling factor transporter transmembrane component T [Clostridium sp. A1-XYC3]
MEDWLYKKDDYIPKKDKDSFIDKSIMSIIHILSLIKRNGITGNGFVYKLNPLIKLIFTVLNILLIALSQEFTYVLIIDAYLLLLVALLDVREIKKILALSLMVPLFTIVMLTPSIIMGNVRNSILLLFKVTGTIISINLLSYTTRWHDITKCLKIFFIPDIFILVFDITIKYIYILGEFSLEMFYALKLRSVGRNSSKYSSLTKIMGNLFLKSKELGDEMYSAMECRGFTGEYKAYSKFSFTFKDILYSFVNVLIIMMYFYFK